MEREARGRELSSQQEAPLTPLLGQRVGYVCRVSIWFYGGCGFSFSIYSGCYWCFAPCSLGPPRTSAAALSVVRWRETTFPGATLCQQGQWSAGAHVSPPAVQDSFELYFSWSSRGSLGRGAGNRLTNARVASVTPLPVSLSGSIIAASGAHLPSKPPALKCLIQVLL